MQLDEVDTPSSPHNRGIDLQDLDMTEWQSSWHPATSQQRLYDSLTGDQKPQYYHLSPGWFPVPNAPLGGVLKNIGAAFPAVPTTVFRMLFRCSNKLLRRATR